MTKEQLEALAEEYVCSLKEDTSWSGADYYINVDPLIEKAYLAGLVKGFELARERAATIVNDGWNIDQARRRDICDFKHPATCDCSPTQIECIEEGIRSMTLVDDGDEK